MLGAPLGSEAFVRRELGRKRVVQDQLLSRFPAVGDLQSAWLLLLFCASPRANYLLRMLPPGATQALARERDTAVRACLAALLFQSARHPLPEPSQRLAHLPLRFGGLRSAVDAAPSAYWASWADCLPAILQSATDRCAPCSCPSRRRLSSRAGLRCPFMGLAAAGAAAARAFRPRLRRLSQGLAAWGFPC